MFKVIEDVKCNFKFSHHAVERFDRSGIEQQELFIKDIMPLFYHTDDDDDCIVWAVQDYIKLKQHQTMVVIDHTLKLSVVIDVYKDQIMNELDFTIITVWDRTDIRVGSNEIVLNIH